MTRKSIDGDREKNPVFRVCVYGLIQLRTSSAEKVPFHPNNGKAGIPSLELPLIP